GPDVYLSFPTRRSSDLDRAARTAFFAKLDLSVNTLTLLLQIFLTGRLMKFLGVTVTLLFMPVLSLFGFAAMGLVPVLAVLAVFRSEEHTSELQSLAYLV